MKTMMVLLVVVLAVAPTHGGPQGKQTRAETQAAADEARLTAALNGMTAGPTQDCVNENELRGNESYGRRVVLFHGPTDDVVYVNRPPAGCPIIDAGRALKVRTPSARLCRGDVLTVFESVSGMEVGGCALGAFTPYRRTPSPTVK